MLKSVVLGAAFTLLLGSTAFAFGGGDANQGQAQGQGQGQAQGQGQGQAQGQNQGQGQDQGQGQSQDASNSNSITVQGDEANPDTVRIWTNRGAYAPDLTAGTNPCAGSWSAGVGAPFVSVSGGNTYQFEECVERATAALLHQMGYLEAGRAFLCNSRVTVQVAFEQAGMPCPSTPDRQQAVTPAVVTDAVEFETAETNQPTEGFWEAGCFDTLPSWRKELNGC